MSSILKALTAAGSDAGEDADSTQIKYSLTLGLITFLLSALYFSWSRNNKSHRAAAGVIDSPWPKVPGAKPIIGNRLIGGTKHLLHNVERWAEQYGSEHGIFECNLFGSRFFVLCNEDKLAQLDKQRPYNVTRRDKVSETFKSTGADGVFTAEGEVWKHDRRLVGPFLNRKNVRDYVSYVKLVASRLTAKWEDSMFNGDGIVTINEDLLFTTMDIISLVAYGEDIDSLRDSGSKQMILDMKYLLRKSMFRIFSPLPYWKIPIIGQYLDGLGWAIYRMTGAIEKNIIQLESSMEKSAVGSANDMTEKKIDDGPTTFLKKLLMHSKKENSALNRDRLNGNLFTFFIAGSETTSNTSCSLLYQLAIDTSGLQDEIAAEVLALQNLESDANLEDIREGLPRLRSFMYEILRLKGPTAFIGFQSKKEFELDGVLIPPNTNFWALTQYSSTVESSQADKCTPRGPNNASLNEFCARRYLVEAEGKTSVLNPSFKTGFRPFGSSLRVCPGRDLAEIEILLIISYILRRFEVGLEDGHPPVKLVTEVTQAPDSDVRLALKPRK